MLSRNGVLIFGKALIFFHYHRKFPNAVAVARATPPLSAAVAAASAAAASAAAKRPTQLLCSARLAGYQPHLKAKIGC